MSCPWLKGAIRQCAVDIIAEFRREESLEARYAAVNAIFEAGEDRVRREVYELAAAMERAMNRNTNHHVRQIL
eukprot:gene5456-17631_t